MAGGDVKIETENADDSEQPANFGRRLAAFDFGYEPVPDARDLGDARLRQAESLPPQPDDPP